MTDEELYNQYLYEKAMYERYGDVSIITFSEWKEIKEFCDECNIVD